MISYDNILLAFAALRNGNVQAITQDDAKLVGLLANVPEAQKAEFESSAYIASPVNIRQWLRRKYPLEEKMVFVDTH